MQGIFSSFQKDRQPVSSGMLSALIQIQRQDLLTGLVDIAYPGEAQALLFFNLGTPFVMYFQEQGNWRKIPSTQWSDIFAQSRGEASIIPMGGDSLRTCMMALESVPGQTEEVLVRSGGFAAHLEQVKARDSASLLRVRDEAFHGLVLVPGRQVDIQDVLTFSPAGIQTEVKGLTRLIGDHDRLVRVTQVGFPLSPQFMQEYALRIVFLALTEPALKRFEQLAGDALVESLDQEVNNYAFHQGWKIQLFGDRVVHRQFFQEAGEALVVYRSMYRVIQHYMHRVVGASLAANIVAEGVDQLPDVYRDIFNQRNFLAA